MIKIDMAVTASTQEELIEALRSAGPNVHSFYGEIVKDAPAAPAHPDIPEEDPGSEQPPAEEAIPDPTPVYTKDEVRAELRKVMQAQSSEAMREILSRFGSRKLDDVDAVHYPAIVAAVQEALTSAS